MIATLIQVSVMRSRTWSVDVRLLSFAREGAQIRGLLVLKTGWAGFDMDRQPQRRLYGNLLWRFRFDLPLAWPDTRPIAFGEIVVTRYSPGIPLTREYLEDAALGDPALRQPAEPQDDQAGNPKDGDDNGRAQRARLVPPGDRGLGRPGLRPLLDVQHQQPLTSDGADSGEGAPTHLLPSQQLLIDHHRALRKAVEPYLTITGSSPFDDDEGTDDL